MVSIDMTQNLQYLFLDIKKDKSSQLSHSWKAKIDNVRSTYPAVDTIPQVIDDVKFRDRKSVDDTIADDREYMAAVERGDTETAQRMVDEAAERAFANSKVRGEDGKLLKVYHGSNADFTVFDKTKGRANMDIQGMFFSPWELDASGYGSNVRNFYLNITNPAAESTGYRALNRHKSENNAGIKAREDLERMGYDGVNNEDEEYIAFNSEQIKSADPVTYDDEGKVIPLSRRFKEDKADIRYSKDDTIDEDYLSAVERSDTEAAQRMVDEAAKAAGYDLHLYHGSKSGGGFTVFKDWQYFTANQAYAERYTQHDTGKGMYNVYVKASRMFDTRNADDRDLFERYRSEYGMSELQDSGLPDWTDGYDLSEIIEENDLDYDGIVLDEGGDLVNGKPVSRGESYVSSTDFFPSMGLTSSIGKNGMISTVYNVGKMKEDTLTGGKIVSTRSGSKAVSVSSDESIPQSSEKSNTPDEKKSVDDTIADDRFRCLWYSNLTVIGIYVRAPAHF